MIYRLELCCCTKTLLAEIAEPKAKQRDVALTYAMALCSGEEKDWAAINEAIIKRWSRSGLERVKRMAWDHVSVRRDVPKKAKSQY